VFVLVLAVPALLVVVAGYAVGHALWAAIVGRAGAEGAGWVTGAVALALAVRIGLSALRRARGRRDRRE
jgi:hypothetical protein